VLVVSLVQVANHLAQLVIHLQALIVDLISQTDLKQIIMLPVVDVVVVDHLLQGPTIMVLMKVDQVVVETDIPVTAETLLVQEINMVLIHLEIQDLHLVKVMLVELVLAVRHIMVDPVEVVLEALA
tara:strand:- start:332 stop:709 length:378 start_codon:yes stop_codon:yes gene_type:complete